jgi:hypothetical protein
MKKIIDDRIIFLNFLWIGRGFIMGLLSFWKNRYNQFTSKKSLRRAKRNQEQDLINEIDRILAETKTKIPLVRNYRKKLKEPLSHALDELSTMISQIPGPLELDPELWEKDPVLKIVFTGSDKFSQWLESCESLRNVFKQTDAAELFGLLVADYNEKTSFGSEINGDILRRDVQHQSVFFEDPRILVPAPDLVLARKELQHRILVMLFTRELNEIADLKSWKEELQRQQDLLEFKLWGDEKPESGKTASASGDKTDEGKKILSAIDQKIEEIGKNLDTPKSHLAHLTRALMGLRQHLRIEHFTLRLNSLGIKVKASSSESFSEISLAEFTFSGSGKRAAIWTQVKRTSMVLPEELLE